MPDFCCKDFERATTDGTDNEGWGALIKLRGTSGPGMGMDLPPIEFCPWCGKKVSGE